MKHYYILLVLVLSAISANSQNIADEDIFCKTAILHSQFLPYTEKMAFFFNDYNEYDIISCECNNQQAVIIFEKRVDLLQKRNKNEVWLPFLGNIMSNFSYLTKIQYGTDRLSDGYNMVFNITENDFKNLRVWLAENKQNLCWHKEKNLLYKNYANLNTTNLDTVYIQAIEDEDVFFKTAINLIPNYKEIMQDFFKEGTVLCDCYNEKATAIFEKRMSLLKKKPNIDDFMYLPFFDEIVLNLYLLTNIEYKAKNFAAGLKYKDGNFVTLFSPTDYNLKKWQNIVLITLLINQNKYLYLMENNLLLLLHRKVKEY